MPNSATPKAPKTTARKPAKGKATAKRKAGVGLAALFQSPAGGRALTNHRLTVPPPQRSKVGRL